MVIAQASVTYSRSTEAEDARLESEIRKLLCGRPIPFKLTRDKDHTIVSAVVPTYYSKQLLLRAAQKVLGPNSICDCISVPYPSVSRVGGDH